MPDQPLSAAETAIANAETEREAFFERASELYDATAQARTAAINPIADKLSAADKKAGAAHSPAAEPSPGASSGSGHTPRPPASGAKPAVAPAASSSDNGQSASAAIPGPPGKASPPATTEAQGAAAQATGQPASDFSDIPAPDAFAQKKVKPDDWKRLHAKADHYANLHQTTVKELETLRARATQSEPPPELTKQLTELQREKEALQSRLEAIAVERSPRFEAAFKPRVEAAIATAKQAVGPDRADRVAQLLQMPESAYRDEQIEAIMQDIGTSSLRGVKLVQAVADLDRVNQERASLASQGTQLYKQWQAEEQATIQRQQQERMQQVTQTFDKVVSDWKKADVGLDDAGIAIARDVFMGKRNYEDMATATMWVAIGPKLAAGQSKALNRVAELEAELARLRGASPGAASDAGSTANGDASDNIPADTGYGEAIARAAMNAGLLRR